MKYPGTRIKFKGWILILSVLFVALALQGYPTSTYANRRKLSLTEPIDHDFPYQNCSLKVIDAEVSDVLQAFADKYHLNIIISQEVKGTISIMVNNIPVKEAFKNILQYADLGYIKEENIYRIKPLKNLAEEEQLSQRSESLQTEIIPLAHANAERIVENLAKFKSTLPSSIIQADKWTNSVILKDTPSKIEEMKTMICRLDVAAPMNEIKELQKSTQIIKLNYINCLDMGNIETLKGKISTHPQTNSVIITDTPENIPNLVTLIKGLDKPIQQILIEAKIVETNKSYSNFIGIQWGGHYNGTPPSGKNFPTISVGGSTVSGSTNYDGSPANYAVNLPGAAYGGVDLLVGHLKDKAALNVRLSAMEDSGNGRIISQPRIMTLDNTEATISSGETIQLPVYQSASSTTVVTGQLQSSESSGSEKEAKTELKVTPHLISDNQIKLKIGLKRDTADYSRPPVNDVPIILTREANTELIILNGETAVIGGLATSGVSNKDQGIPWLSQIPVLGWLFKSKAKISEYGELLVFITPHLVQGQQDVQAEQ